MIAAVAWARRGAPKTVPETQEPLIPDDEEPEACAAHHHIPLNVVRKTHCVRVAVRQRNPHRAASVALRRSTATTRTKVMGVCRARCVVRTLCSTAIARRIHI